MKQDNLRIDKNVNLWNAYMTTHIMQVLGAIFLGTLIIGDSYVWYLLSAYVYETSTEDSTPSIMIEKYE